MQTAVDLLCKQNRKIVEFTSRGFFREAILLFKQLHSDDPHHLTCLAIVLPSVIKACQIQLEHLSTGLQIHALLIKTAHHRFQIPISNSLLMFYVKHSHIRQARFLFDTMPVKDVVSWACMINAYVQTHFLSEALILFKLLLDTRGGGGDIWADAVFRAKPQLVAMVISVCGRTGNLGFGKQIHAKIAVMSLHRCALISSSLVHISTSLVGLYSRCLEFSDARKVFARMSEKNIVSWTALINGSLTAGDHRLCFELFRSQEMWDHGVNPNRATLLAILSACGQMGAFRHGKQIHGYSFRHDLYSSDMIVAALVDMYTRCRETLASRYGLLVFQSHESRDVVMWSSIIHGHVRNGDVIGALTLFHQMRTEDVIKPNSVTMLAIIRACTGIGRVWFDLGTWIHTLVIKYGFSSDVVVANSLIDMYAQCGFLNHSIQTFKEMPARDKVSWSSMISSLGYHGRGEEAVSLYRDLSKLDDDSGLIDEITLLAVLSACNHSGLIDEGRAIFNHAVKNHGDLLSSQHYACYADLLGRGGQIEEAHEVVTNTIRQTTCTRMLTSLISACKSDGRFNEAVGLGCKLIEKDPSNPDSYGLLSQVHAENGEWMRAEKLRFLMRRRRLIKCSGRSWIVTN